jgi:hypothetical protein
MNPLKIKKLIPVFWSILMLSGVVNADVDEVKRKINNERINLNLKDAALSDVFNTFKTLLGVEIRIVCAGDRKISIVFDNLTVRTSLNAICESAGLHWSLEETHPPVLRIECEDKTTANCMKPGDSFNFSLKNLSFNTFLKLASDVFEAELILDGKLSGKQISLELKNVSIQEALDVVCHQAGAKWHMRLGEHRALIVEAAE